MAFSVLPQHDPGSYFNQLKPVPGVFIYFSLNFQCKNKVVLFLVFNSHRLRESFLVVRLSL